MIDTTHCVLCSFFLQNQKSHKTGFIVRDNIIAFLFAFEWPNYKITLITYSIWFTIKRFANNRVGIIHSTTISLTHIDFMPRNHLMTFCNFRFWTK